MRCLARNKVKVYVAPYLNKEPLLDEYGNETGEWEILNGNPVEIKASVSPATGEIVSQIFGDSERYDKIIAIDNFTHQIGAYDLLWVDRSPELNDEGEATVVHDYIVKKIAKNLNSTSIAISKVDVSE